LAFASDSHWLFNRERLGATPISKVEYLWVTPVRYNVVAIRIAAILMAVFLLLQTVALNSN
jgi:hypothetical protein